jgi:hypothetical protein
MNDRFVIHNLHAEYPRDVVAELSPGTHRVTVHDDGTVEVVGLLEQCESCGHEREFHEGRRCSVCWDFCVYRSAYRDVPAEPEDGAR